MTNRLPLYGRRASKALPNPLSFVQLSNDKYDKAKNLMQKIPSNLYEEMELVIGLPDAGDLGGFYVETNIGGQKRYWLIDKIENNIPEYLHAFTREMSEAIDDLSSD